MNVAGPVNKENHQSAGSVSTNTCQVDKDFITKQSPTFIHASMVSQLDISLSQLRRVA